MIQVNATRPSSCGRGAARGAAAYFAAALSRKSTSELATV